MFNYIAQIGSLVKIVVAISLWKLQHVLTEEELVPVSYRIGVIVIQRKIFSCSKTKADTQDLADGVKNYASAQPSLHTNSRMATTECVILVCAAERLL